METRKAKPRTVKKEKADSSRKKRAMAQRTSRSFGMTVWVVGHLVGCRGLAVGWMGLFAAGVDFLAEPVKIDGCLVKVAVVHSYAVRPDPPLCGVTRLPSQSEEGLAIFEVARSLCHFAKIDTRCYLSAYQCGDLRSRCRSQVVNGLASIVVGEHDLAS
jgi:hypothetical protein